MRIEAREQTEHAMLLAGKATRFYRVIDRSMHINTQQKAALMTVVLALISQRVKLLGVV